MPSARLEHVLKENLGKLMARLDQHGRAGDVLQIHYMFKALASDLITFYSFDQCLNLLGVPDYGKMSFDASDSFFLLTHLGKVVPWLVGLVTKSPTWLLNYLFPDMADILARRNAGLTPLTMVTLGLT